MSPPEVWGPAVWRLFHTLSGRLSDATYNALSPQLFNQIVRICRFLPCPECSNDASNFLAKIKLSEIKNKEQFKNTFYLFHNWVNAKKRKPLFNYGNINIYNQYRIIDVVNDFIAKYQTKGNMKLLTESFQRQLIIKDFKKWISFSIHGFIPIINIPNRLPEPNNNINDNENTKQEEQIVAEEEQIVVSEEEHVVVEEEQIVAEEEQIVVSEEQIVSEEEQIVAEEEQIVVSEEEHVVVEEEEHVVVAEEEQIVSEEEHVVVSEEIEINMDDIYVENVLEETVKPKRNKKIESKKIS